jgi:hypothetical protein
MRRGPLRVVVAARSSACNAGHATTGEIRRSGAFTLLGCRLLTIKDNCSQPEEPDANRITRANDLLGIHARTMVGMLLDGSVAVDCTDKQTSMVPIT